MYRKVTTAHSAQLRCLHQICGMTGKELCALFPRYTRTTVYRHMKLAIAEDEEVDKRKSNKGRPPKLSARHKRHVLRQIPKLRISDGHFTSKAIQHGASIDFSCNR